MVSELGLSLDEMFVLGDKSRSEVDDLDTPGRGAAAFVQRAADRRSIELESGVHWERLTAWNDADIEFMEAVYEVGGASSPDGKLVRHSGREFGLVLTGTLGVTVAFEEYVLEPGDSISFESTVPHRLHNDGDEVVRAVWVTLGRHGSAQAFSKS
jgi:mannose-6-phosphate isomerase-like protein (cupin superfamily)